ncbi:MAG: DPP IV N-terminal domain-containing protein [Actinomycetota bacterium]
MPDLDEYLRNELRRMVRPVDVNDLSSKIDVRRTRRTRLRKIQAVALTVVVLAGTAGGVLMLSNVFRTHGAEVGSSANVGNGVIVYSEVRNAGQQLWSVHPDGTGARQLTTGDGFSDTSPSVSPDGRTIAFTRTDEHGSAIFTIGVEGDRLTRLAGAPATDPAWSPDGTQLAFAGSPGGPNGIYVIGADGANPRLVPGTDELSVAHPAWSPDGMSIVFEAAAGAPEAGATWDVYSAPIEGGGLKDLSQTPDASEITPAWSPDGSRLAFARNGSLWLRDIATGNESQLTSSIGRQLDANPSWSPDGLSIVFDRRLATGTFLMTMGADGSGITLVARNAIDAAWQAVSANDSPIPSASPSPSPTPTNAEVDLGLGFPVCNVRSIRADFDGNGTIDAASVATKIGDLPDCPAPGTSTEVLVADLNGNGKADAVGGPLACPTGCEPFATPDVDGDGLPEIAIVVDQPGDGTKRIQVWDFTTPPGGELAVVPFVDANGDPATFTWGTVNNWGGNGPEVFGVSCTSRTSPPLVTEWQAIPTGPNSWHVSEHGYHVVGTQLRSSFEDSYDVPGEETVFPDGGGDTMCGAPVQPTG